MSFDAHNLYDGNKTYNQTDGLKFTPEKAGRYTVIITATDAKGNKVTQKVTVKATVFSASAKEKIEAVGGTAEVV